MTQQQKQTPADELQQFLEKGSQVFSDYVRDSHDPQRPVISEQFTKELQKEISQFPRQGYGSKIWNDIDAICRSSTNTWSPRFLYKLYAAPTPIGVVSETLLGVLNNNSHVFKASPAGTLIEQAVAKQLAKMAGFPEESGGLTFPGGSYSNLHALLVARNQKCPEIKHKGLSRQLAVFTSMHAHYSIDKAAMAAGVGLDNVVHVPTDEQGRMDPQELRRLMRQAEADGKLPFFVNATMGTTVLGACDPVEEIAQVCQEFDAWLHVDGSWGGPLALFASSLVPSFSLPAGKVDSLVINPHKLLGVPLQCSFLLVHQGLDAMQQALGMNAAYLFHETEAGCDVGDATLGCGRRPDAIKFWLMWRFYGTDYFVSRLTHARQLAQCLAHMVQTRVSSTGRWVLFMEPASTCVCFWYVPNSLKTCVDSLYPTEWGMVTKQLCDFINQKGSMLVDYATITMSQGQTIPAFFRIPLNSPDVTKDTLNDLLDTIEQASIQVYSPT